MPDGQEGADCLAERIIRDLKTIFGRNEDILEFDIIPVDKQLVNKCPVIHVEGRVGLESWCVKHVFKYAYRRLLAHRTSNAKQMPSELSDLSFVLLLVNPDIAVAWNVRKELILSNHLNPHEELRLSEVVLSRKPKSPDNFSHRQWVLRQILSSSPDQEMVDELSRNELRVSLFTASKYQRNYYAWSHRFWVLGNMCNFRLDFINYEMHLTRHWAENHVSDYSGFQYRQNLLLALHRNALTSTSQDMKSVEKALDTELEMLNNLTLLYNDRESLFCHRRFVLSKLVEWFPSRSTKLREAEIGFIENHSNHAYSNNTWQFQLITRHVRWLKNVFKWELNIDPEQNTCLAKVLTALDSKLVPNEGAGGQQQVASPLN